MAMLFTEPNFTEWKTYNVALIPDIKMHPIFLNLAEILETFSTDFKNYRLGLTALLEPTHTPSFYHKRG